MLTDFVAVHFGLVVVDSALGLDDVVAELLVDLVHCLGVVVVVALMVVGAASVVVVWHQVRMAQLMELGVLLAGRQGTMHSAYSLTRSLSLKVGNREPRFVAPDYIVLV